MENKTAEEVIAAIKIECRMFSCDMPCSASDIDKDGLCKCDRRIKAHMDEYAQQQSIGFAEWLAEEGYRARPSGNEYYHGLLPHQSRKLSHLYQIYSQQKGK